MPTSAHAAAANSPGIFVKSVHPARADVGIGPYSSPCAQGEPWVGCGRLASEYLRRGGEAYAYYVTYRGLYGHDHCKTQKPPLGKVTVS